MFELRRGEDAGCDVSIRMWFEPSIPDSLNRAFESAFTWIDHVHGVTDPSQLFHWPAYGRVGRLRSNLNVGCVPVREDERPDVWGSYIPSSRNEGESSIGPRMTINPRFSGKAATVVHECLHLIHREILNIDRGMSRRTASRLVLLLGFIHRTKTYKECLRMASGTRALYENLRGKESNDPSVMRQISDIEAAAALAEYYMLDEEWLARCYSHMIQMRAIAWRDNPYPLQHRHVERDENWLPLYLSESEISKFDKKVAKMFRLLGWRKMSNHDVS